MKKKLMLAGFAVLLVFSGAVCLMAADIQLTDLERLGMHLYKDKNLSLYQN